MEERHRNDLVDRCEGALDDESVRRKLGAIRQLFKTVASAECPWCSGVRALGHDETGASFVDGDAAVITTWENGMMTHVVPIEFCPQVREAPRVTTFAVDGRLGSDV